MRANGSVPAAQVPQLLQVAPPWHAQAGLPSQPEVPTSALRVHGDGCMSGALPNSRVVAWKRAERDRSYSKTSGACAGYIAELGPFTVAGSERARFAAMRSPRSQALGNPFFTSPIASRVSPTDGEPAGATQPTSRT